MTATVAVSDADLPRTTATVATSVTDKVAVSLPGVDTGGATSIASSVHACPVGALSPTVFAPAAPAFEWYAL